jgi:hypothetical protein
MCLSLSYSGLNSSISFLDEVFRLSTQLFCVYPSVIRPTCPESRVGLSSRNPRSAWTTSRQLVDDLKTELDIVRVACFFGLDIYVFSDIFLWWLNTSELDFYIFFGV